MWKGLSDLLSVAGGSEDQPVESGRNGETVSIGKRTGAKYEGMGSDSMFGSRQTQQVGETVSIGKRTGAKYEGMGSDSSLGIRQTKQNDQELPVFGKKTGMKYEAMGTQSLFGPRSGNAELVSVGKKPYEGSKNNSVCGRKENPEQGNGKDARVAQKPGEKYEAMGSDSSFGRGKPNSARKHTAAQPRKKQHLPTASSPIETTAASEDILRAELNAEWRARLNRVEMAKVEGEKGFLRQLQRADRENRASQEEFQRRISAMTSEAHLMAKEQERKAEAFKQQEHRLQQQLQQQQHRFQQLWEQQQQMSINHATTVKSAKAMQEQISRLEAAANEASRVNAALVSDAEQSELEAQQLREKLEQRDAKDWGDESLSRAERVALQKKKQAQEKERKLNKEKREKEFQQRAEEAEQRLLAAELLQKQQERDYSNQMEELKQQCEALCQEKAKLEVAVADQVSAKEGANQLEEHLRRRIRQLEVEKEEWKNKFKAEKEECNRAKQKYDEQQEIRLHERAEVESLIQQAESNQQQHNTLLARLTKDLATSEQRLRVATDEKDVLQELLDEVYLKNEALEATTAQLRDSLNMALGGSNEPPRRSQSRPQPVAHNFNEAQHSNQRVVDNEISTGGWDGSKRAPMSNVGLGTRVQEEEPNETGDGWGDEVFPDVSDDEDLNPPQKSQPTHDNESGWGDDVLPQVSSEDEQAVFNSQNDKEADQIETAGQTVIKQATAESNISGGWDDVLPDFGSDSEEAEPNTDLNDKPPSESRQNGSEVRDCVDVNIQDKKITAKVDVAPKEGGGWAGHDDFPQVDDDETETKSEHGWSDSDALPDFSSEGEDKEAGQNTDGVTENERQLEAERLAEEEDATARQAEEEMIAAEQARRTEEARKASEEKARQDEAAADKAREKVAAAAEKARQERLAEERLAEERRLEGERAAAEKARQEEKRVEAEKARQEEERRAEEARAVARRREEERAQQEEEAAAAEKARREEKRRLEEERAAAAKIAKQEERQAAARRAEEQQATASQVAQVAEANEDVNVDDWDTFLSEENLLPSKSTKPTKAALRSKAEPTKSGNPNPPTIARQANTKSQAKKVPKDIDDFFSDFGI